MDERMNKRIQGKRKCNSGMKRWQAERQKEWIGGWMKVWKDGRMRVWMKGWKNGRIVEWIEWMNKKDERMKKSMDKTQ